MGSFMERHNCSDREDICWSLIDLVREIIKKLPEEEREQWRNKVNIYNKLFNEESGLSWEEARARIRRMK